RYLFLFFFFQAEDGIRDRNVTGVQTCALPIFVHYSYKMSEVDYLVNGVIYGFGEPAVEDPVSQPKSTKISKSTTSNSESEAKERSEERRVGKEKKRRKRATAG